MNLQPTLENELVRIRPLKSQDLEALYAIAKDPKIWEQHPAKRYLRDVFETFFQESIDSKGAFIISSKLDGAIIGSSRFKKVEGFPNGIEIGWTFIAREYWGGKYNNSIKNLMIEHAFHYVDNILFYVAKDNFRSQKAVEKINGQKIPNSENLNIPRKGMENHVYILKKSVKTS